ncbi:MAG: 1-acyl-sn-glycerol-3-phosphate acyltransferase [Myxococcales bacterium]|nr:1-acyl-sn-glycerol-3-phosphate acyltransferase [Myxococcales bacterium]
MAEAVRIYRVVAVAAMFALFFFGGLLIALFLLPITWIAGPPRTAYLRCRRFISRGFASYLKLLEVLGLIRFSSDFDRHTERSPCVMVANHPTILDVVSIVAYTGPICVIIRHTATRNIFFSLLTRLCDHIIVREGSIQDAQTVMDEAVRRITELGETLLIFPEGTRSPVRGLHRFLRAPFDIAQKAKVPIVPIVVHCDPPVLKKGGSVVRWPNVLVQYHLEESAPIQVGPSRRDAIDARDRTYRLILARSEASRVDAADLGLELPSG